MLPLKDAAASKTVTALGGALPAQRGRHDLCFTFTGKGIDPMWALDWVQLHSADAPTRAEG